MTTPESHEATQIVSNLEAIRTIVSEKNHMGRMTNLKEALSEKMIIVRTDHSDLKNSQTNLPSEEITIPSVQKIIQKNPLVEEAAHLIKMILQDLLTKKIPSINLIDQNVLLTKKITSNVPIEMTLQDLLTVQNVLLIKEIVSNVQIEMIPQDLLTVQSVLLIKEIVSNVQTEMTAQDHSIDQSVLLTKETVSNVQT
ncbi:hypothetical protein ACR78Y_26000, partial [Sphingobacterium multivorum]